MSKYLFIETRDPFESTDCVQGFELINELKGKGHDVSLYLIQNGVFTSRSGVKVPGFSNILSSGVKVLVDDCSLEERGILSDQIAAGISISGADELVDLIMEENCKAIWH